MGWTGDARVVREKVGWEEEVGRRRRRYGSEARGGGFSAKCARVQQRRLRVGSRPVRVEAHVS